jgi:hypothetical protein
VLPLLLLSTCSSWTCHIKPRMASGPPTLLLLLLLQDGRTPLHLAAEKGHLDVVELLLGAGAAANATDKVRPPLHVQMTGEWWSWMREGEGLTWKVSAPDSHTCVSGH